MLLQDRYCGYCETLLLMDQDSCDCWESTFHLDNPPIHVPFHYSASSLAEAEAFLTKFPEFKEHQNLLYANRIGAYESPENEDYVLPANFDSDNLPIEVPFANGDPTREDEWDGIYASRDNYQREQLTYWRDVEPARCTSATWYWSNNPGDCRDTLPIPHIKVRNQKVLFTLEETYEQRYQGLDYEGKDVNDLPLYERLGFSELQGFASETLIDLNITERYQYRFFNIYIGNDDLLHVGLLSIGNGEVRCTRGDCYYRTHPKAIPDTTDRSCMEQFTHDIIRHGNNHGPDWYITRKDFAFIHAENCNTDHSRTEFCNSKAPRPHFDLTTLDGTLEFLIRHRKFCRDNRCRCTAYYHSLSYYSRQLTAA